MNSVVDPIFDALRLTWSQIQILSPRLVSASLLLIVGWLVARLVRQGLIKLLRLAHLESAAERTGVETFLMRGGVPFTAVTLTGAVVYWLLMLVVALAVFNVLGLQVSTTLLEQVSDYLPNILVALVIVVFGSMLSRFLGGVVETYLNNIGVERAEETGFLVRAAMIAFVLTLALRQLQFAGDVLLSAFQLAFGGFCLALALAFGLGGKEWAAGILQRRRKSR
jgi:hypothetical protein